ncbi:MAG: S1C family serine protease [Verrucomicrobiales bacterium]|jgi:S1-C subfamily serine protease|nr:S1C family serine protease [Verrucomicrobiales bacterium]
MRRLIFLILFVLLTVGILAWLTGIEGPFASARTHSVLTKGGKMSAGGNFSSAKEAKPAGTSLLLGSNVDSSKPGANKAQAAAMAAVPSLVAIETKPGARWGENSAAKRLVTKLAANGLTPVRSGSGFFIDRQGTILTNFGALLNGYAWTAHTTDGKDYEVTLLGADAATDLALVRIARPDTTPVRWAGAAPNFAEDLLMLGFDPKEGPRVIDAMASSGLLEVTDPVATLTLKYYLVDGTLAEQRDGWLLLNLDGAAAGVVARIEHPHGRMAKETTVLSPEGIGPVLELLQNSPLVHRIYPGIECQELTPELANLTASKLTQGLLVTNVRDDSPLNAAGLRADDVIISLGNTAVTAKAHFYQSLSNMAVGAKVPLGIRRGDRSMTLQVILREYHHGAQELLQDWLDLVAKHRKDQADQPAR